MLDSLRRLRERSTQISKASNQRQHRQKPPAELAAEANDLAEAADELPSPDLAPIVAAKPPAEARANKVFISHGKNKAFVDPIKELLKFGQLEAIVSVEESYGLAERRKK